MRTKLPRPSNHSVATATGSKRLSADSDLLLCHVGLWRTSRFRFGCVSGCEHSKMRFILIVPSAHILDSRPPTLLCGRADNACTNLLGYFVRYVRTRGIAEIVGSGKTADFRSALCGTHLPRMACATNSCTPRRFGRRTARVLLADFCRAFGHSKAREKRSFFMYLAGEQCSPLQAKTKVPSTAKIKDICLVPVSTMPRQE